jgi:hypothetical protein
MVTPASAAGVAAVAGLAVGGWFYAALYPTSQIFGRVVIAGNDPGEIALTYDDGPNPAATPRLLEVLAKQDVQATFFLIGEFVRKEPGLVREIAAAGHAIGNHTMTHPWLLLHLFTCAQRDSGLQGDHRRHDWRGDQAVSASAWSAKAGGA